MAIDKLGRDVFVALASIAHADGKVQSDEAAAIMRAARAEGLTAADLLAVTAAIASESPFSPDSLPRLSSEEATFVYAVAYWVSRIDGEMSEAEDVVLGTLGKALGLADDARMAAEGLVDEVAAMPQGERPARYDLQRLREVIGKRHRA